MYKEEHRKKHSHIRKCTIIFFTLVVLLLAVGSIFAKYIYNNGGKNLLSAKEFYFTSNLLTENTAKYVLNSTTTEVSFTLGNNADKLCFSQDDIEFSIIVECKNSGIKPTIVYTDSEQVLKGGSVDTTTITLKNLEMGETYIVTAIGEAGYRQALKAEFTVTDKEENIYKHLDTSNDAYVLLTVWTQNVKGKLTIGVTENGLIPDNTDHILREVYNYQNGEYGTMDITDSSNFTVGYASYTYRFFISDSSRYSADNFDVFIENSGTTYLAKEEIPQ